ncbi:lysophospholipid acyltransferase family protein [Glycomyces arizonensis]|uniref:lysophospholipid acyltransferase family protein n=1 Tax=Glycomyces arizonensis TaxID=256035 RepID=UPI001FDF0898|nr:lysophospholipid acyltransferase family protein [Glycomyces arizonensis]
MRNTGELNTVLYKTLQWTAAPTIKLIWRPWIDGRENIPETGPVILASNHLSVADHYFLGLTTKRHIATMAKIEYFTGAGLKGKVISKTVKALGQVAVDRSGGRRSAASLEPSMKVLEEGRVFAIFPEGTRSPDGRLYRGKPGVARLALATGAPVVPVGMIGTEKVLPIGESRPRVAPVGVRIGKPLDFSRYQGMENDRVIIRAVTDEIMDAIRQLTGQEYVDKYAKRNSSSKDEGDSD